MAEIIARVGKVTGEVFARDADGKLRRLKSGDPILEGEVVQAGAGGEAQLKLADGRDLVVRANEAAKLDAEVAAPDRPDAGDSAVQNTPTRFAKISKAVVGSDGTFSFEDDGGRGQFASVQKETHTFVELLRVVESVSPLGFEFDASRSYLGDVVWGFGQVERVPMQEVGTAEYEFAETSFPLRELPQQTSPIAVTLNEQNENDNAPVNTVPATQSATEDLALAISGLSVNDVDGNLASSQISVAHGSLTVDLSGGATISAGTNGSGTLTLSGTQAQINAALATVSYQGDADYNGSDTLTIVSKDSAGTPLSDSDTVTINVAAANDAPTATDEIIPIPKNSTHILSVADFGINDPDVNDILSVTITSVPGQGELWHYDGTVWVKVSANDVIPKDDIDNNLLVYVPAAGDTGNESLNFTVSDGTVTTVGHTLTFSINIELTVSNPLPVDEGHAVVFSVELSNGRTVATELALSLGGAATAADYQTPLQYRVQNLDGSYSAWANVSGNINLAAGSTRLEVKVKTIVDAIPDEYESLTLTATIANYSQSDMANTSATGQTAISDTPSLQVSGPSYIREGADAVFDLELSSTKATSTVVTLSFEGVAVVGTDFEYSVDGGTTWITSPTTTVTIPADAVNSPSFEVLVRTLSETPNEIDEILRLVATTSDTGIANSGTGVAAETYIVDPVAVTVNEDANAFAITPAAGYSYAALGAAAHGTVVDNGDGTLTYKPDLNYSGTDSFTITKTNDVGLTVNSTVTVTVVPVADAPLVSIDISGVPANGTTVTTNVVANGDFSQTISASNWTTSSAGSPANGSATVANGVLTLHTGNNPSKVAWAQQSLSGLDAGTSYTFHLTMTSTTVVMWNGSLVTPTSYSGGIGTFTVTAAVANTLRLQSPATAGADVNLDDVVFNVSHVQNYTYTVDATALLKDTDGSETLGGNITITSSTLPAGAVLKLRDGTTLVADTDSGTGYSWTVARDQATGLQLTVDRLPGTTFSLNASATSTETANLDSATGTATTGTITMPSSGTSTPNLLPQIGDSEVILSNEAGFVGSVTQTIDTQFGDGTNTFSWVSTVSSLPDIYANGELVTYTLAVSADGMTGTITGSTSGGDVFQLVIHLNPGADADVTYTQYQSLLGTEVVGTVDSLVTGGGNNADLNLTFTAGGMTFDAKVTGENYVDGTTTTINTNNQYIGAANNLMNPGEKVTLDFLNGTTSNAVSSMMISFFNFDSESHTAPDELTVIGTTVDGSTFTYHVTNASLDASGHYTITAPGGALIGSLVFEAGTQSSFKLGIESVSAVRYDVNFDLTLDYQLTDVDGDSATGTITVTLDGDNSIVGTTADDVLLGGSANETITGDAGSDRISGGVGDDVLTGGTGADTFAWTLGDAGVAGAPARDTITDFSTADYTAGGDRLDLRDLLSGSATTPIALDDYLDFSKSGTSDTLIQIRPTGASGTVTQEVLLQGIDLTSNSTLSDLTIIQDLLAKGKLQTD